MLNEKEEMLQTLQNFAMGQILEVSSVAQTRTATGPAYLTKYSTAEKKVRHTGQGMSPQRLFGQISFDAPMIIVCLESKLSKTTGNKYQYAKVLGCKSMQT